MANTLSLKVIRLQLHLQRKHSKVAFTLLPVNCVCAYAAIVIVNVEM